MNENEKPWWNRITLALAISLAGTGISGAFSGERTLRPLRDLIEDADLILVGSVVDLSRDVGGKYFVSTVHVEEVLKGSISSKKRDEFGRREVFILQEMPFTDSSAVLTPQGRDLLLLRVLDPDIELPEDLKLDGSLVYRVSHGWEGVFNLFDPLAEERRKKAQSGGIKDPRRPQEVCLDKQYGIKSVDGYWAVVKEFYNLMKMEAPQKKVELLKLLKSKSAVREESAVAELKQLGVRVEKVAGEYQIAPEEHGQENHLQEQSPAKGGKSAPKQRNRGTKRARKAHGPGEKEKK